MKNLENTRRDYISNLRGNKNYRMITRCGDEWYYLDHNDAHLISSLKIDIKRNNEWCDEYSYAVNEFDFDPLGSTMVMDLSQSKLIVDDCNGCYGFGFDDVESPADGIRIRFQTSELSGIVTALRNSLSVIITQTLTDITD
jgi:hypothetical protein